MWVAAGVKADTFLLKQSWKYVLSIFALSLLASNLKKSRYTTVLLSQEFDCFPKVLGI